MSQELASVSRLMSGIGKTTKPHKFPLPKGKKTQAKGKHSEKSEKTESDKEATKSKPREKASESLPSSKSEEAKKSPKSGRSTDQPTGSWKDYQRPGSTYGKQSPKALPGPSKKLTPPGPTAREQAASRSKASAKGTKNTSTIKVAEAAVDLEAPGMPTVYRITDLPRQWKPNG